MSDDIKYCIDCKHLDSKKKLCHAGPRGHDIVTGEKMYHEARSMRENRKCGPSAQLFELKT